MKQHLKIGLVISFFLAVVSAFGQLTISGNVKNITNNPIPSASITLSKLNSKIILAFAFSNKEGNYTIQYNNAGSKDTFELNAFAMNYSIFHKVVFPGSQLVDIRLSPQITRLPNVTVKNTRPVVKLQGDTLNYDVIAFRNPQDRSIGDIIRRLPGVELDNTGKITYQGKAISNLYIDGDNLLDDKYNIATRSIPGDMVDKVQILENHQPIRVLKNLAITDIPAINLVLKPDARIKLIGEGNVAIGDRGTYEAMANALLLKKQVKFINYFKLNNNGSDLAGDIVSQFQPKFGAVLNMELLNINSIGNPNLEKRRYLQNTTGLVTLNNLFKLENEVQLKINGYYLYDKQYQYYEGTNTYYLPLDTIQYAESQYTNRNKNIFRTQFNIDINKNNYYLDNKTLIDNISKTGQAELNANKNITQQISGSVTTIQNELNYKKVLKNKQVLEGYSYIGNIQNLQTLDIFPGLYPSLLNENIAYKQISQNLYSPTFYINTYLKYYTRKKNIVQSYEAGFATQAQQLNSSIKRVQLNDSVRLAPDSFRNLLSGVHTKMYIESNFDWIVNHWQIGSTLIGSFESFQYENNLHFQDKKLYRFLPITPALRIKFQIGQKSFITGNYEHTQTFGGIRDVYEGYILNNYRSFFNNYGPVFRTHTDRSTITYNYRNTGKLFFVNAGATYNKADNNSISTDILSNEVQLSTRKVSDQNKSSAFIIFLGANKYFSNWHTTISLKSSWQRGEINLMQNGSLLHFISDNSTSNFSIRSRIISWLNTEYNCSYIYYVSKHLNIQGRPFTDAPSSYHIQQKLNITINPSTNYFMNLSAEQYINQSTGMPANHILFADFSFVLKIPGIHSDFEFFINNITGNNIYPIINVSENNISKTIYTIRPRSALLKYSFHF